MKKDRNKNGNTVEKTIQAKVIPLTQQLQEKIKINPSSGHISEIAVKNKCKLISVAKYNQTECLCLMGAIVTQSN